MDQNLKITRRKGKKKSNSKPLTTCNNETAQKLPIDCINGNSSLVKFFPTEVSDDENILDLQNENHERVNKKAQRFRAQRGLKGFPTEGGLYSRGDNGKLDRNSNIDVTCHSIPMAGPKLHADLDRVALENCNYSIPLESDKIVSQRPNRAMAMEQNVVPNVNNQTEAQKTAKKKKKHIYDDSEDVTLLRKRYALRQDLINSEDPWELPLSVISEQLQGELFLPHFQKSELYRFGSKYETNLFQLVHQYLELDTFHSVGFVGQEKGSLAPLLEKHFCLIKPVVSIYPGKIDYRDVNDQKLLAFKIAHVGAEEYFSQNSKDTSRERLIFDRIILHDSIHFFKDLDLTLRHIVGALHEYGKILIIHRPGSLNTLPFFLEAKLRICEEEVPYMKIITSLQKIGCDVEWDLVHVPIEMPTAKWLSMLKAKFPPQLEIMSDFEIECGLRELSEGPFKYLQGANMEAEDRLMFITASQPNFDCAFPSVQRVGGASQVPYSSQADVEYTLPLTDDLEMFLPKSKAKHYQMKGLF